MISLIILYKIKNDGPLWVLPILQTIVLNDLINKTLPFLNSVHNLLRFNQPLTSVTVVRSNESNQILKALEFFHNWAISGYSAICTAGSVCLVECESCFQTRMLSRIAISQQWPVVHFKERTESQIMWLVYHVILFPVSQWWRGNWMTLVIWGKEHIQ